MTTYTATYDNGQVIFDEEPKIKKSKVRIIFLDEKEAIDTKKKFLSDDLGDFINISRESLYDRELSD